jgi:geranylgeranyl reductase
MHEYDVVVIGGGPAGATAADDLAKAGRKVLLVDRAGRIKPCGGAIPPRAMQDFQIPESMLVARAQCARMISPTDQRVDIPIEGGYVGLVDRDTFDEWLRSRAQQHGAHRIIGSFESLQQEDDGNHVKIQLQVRQSPGSRDETPLTVRARIVIGADGAKSRVAHQALPESAAKGRFVFAYHEIVRAPGGEQNASSAGPDHTPGQTARSNSARSLDYDPARCDVYYRGSLSPDFYGWVFPHGKCLSVGTGSMDKGFSLRNAVSDLRKTAGLDTLETLRREGAPIPLKPLPRWDNGRNVVLAGDASGVVAPASGEGIYYAMLGGRLAAEASLQCLATGQGRALTSARKRFMREHGRVFFILGLLQRFWYVSDKRREQFVNICRDRDVQQLTFESYMYKRLVRKKPMAHVRIFLKDVAHLLGIARA